MGRVKLQIKKIENITNRQVTYSKRRNGLIKKAYELSVLCDVDVALIMFSPSGRATVFSGNNNKSVEEVIARYVDLPEHERGRKLQTLEHLQGALSKMKRETDRSQHPTSQVSAEIQAEDIQQEILRCKIQLEDMKKRLRIFEGDPSGITTLTEAQYREQILEDTLKNVSRCKQVLEENYNFSNTQSSSQDDRNGIIARDPTNTLNWAAPRDAQIQIMNFLDSNGLLPLRGHCNGVNNLQLPDTIFLHELNNIQVDDQTSPSSGMEDDDNTQQAHMVPPMELNHSPWTEFYQIGNGAISAAQPREKTLLELYLSQLTS